MFIAQNIQRIRQKIPANVCLVAVSKMHSAADIMEAYNAGQRDFGESRPQELLLKVSVLPHDIRWHFIGHLQSNKVKMVVPHVHLIHSIDSEKLLHEVNTFCKKNSATARCLLQVHVAQEDTKFGFRSEELLALLQNISLENFSGITLAGLMGMASNTENMEQVRGEFHHIKMLHEQAKLLLPHPELFSHISMGMSHDYPIAVDEGATIIRVGSSIFKEG